MKTTTKRFDCVKMKNDIQAAMLREYRGLSDAEIQARIEQDLATSDAPAARLWRELTGRHAVSKVAEAPARYTAQRRKRATGSS
jgi:hypothetical protein